MEKWDILDSHGNLTGKSVVRQGVCLASGEYHLVVHIWIISSTGKLLIQRRSKNKKYMPGEWAATGGSVLSGETSRAAAKRELAEELGIHMPPDKFRFIAKFKRRNSFVDVWTVRCDVPPSRLHLQRSEVSSARWVTPDELKAMLAEGKYHNYGEEYFKTVFAAAQKSCKGNKE